jgi:methionine synthase II (cobalamin-independent)
MIKTNFQADSLPALIGSLPMDDHVEAVKLMMEYTPEIPLWVQLPVFKQEGMMAQFLPGMPGLTVEKDKTYINTSGETFEPDVLKFYEDYLAVTEGTADLSESRFALTPDIARGFFELMKSLKRLPHPPVAVKGQITGPFTFGTGVVDQNGRAIFYNEQLKDVAVKLIAMKARWQIRQLSSFGCPVILFFDEPGLTGFGSSAFISISRKEVENCLQEAIDAVHAEGGLAGVHICANAEWSLLLESSLDIVSFDAYSFFDKFMLYPDQIKKFIQRGGILAWGIVPTSNTEDVTKETADSLISKWERQAGEIEALGIDRKKIKARTLITPSCGTGSLPLDSAKKVLKLTKEVSEKIRNK